MTLACRHAGRGFLAIVALLGFPGSAFAGADMDAAHAKLRAIGKVWDAKVNEQTLAIYAPLQAKASKDGIVRTADVAYGPDARHKLDVFAPAEKAGGLKPVVVYIHGGGWVRGDKVIDNPSGLFHHNVASYFVRNGMIGVNATYRLVPNVQWPGGGDDVALMAKWLKANIAQYGGDPNAIFMIGHSAGGTHLGTYLYNAGSQPADGPEIAGAIFLSPAVDVPPPGGPREPVVRQYFGEDPAKWRERAPVGLVDAYKGRRVPTFLVTAEFDPAEIEVPSAELYTKLCRKYDACPRYLQLQGHNHVSSAYGLNTDDPTFGADAVGFVRSVLAPQTANR